MGNVALCDDPEKFDDCPVEDQNHLAQANYYRDPMHLDSYLSKVHFLPYINNEVVGQENATYAKNFAALEKLALLMALDDSMVHPRKCAMLNSSLSKICDA